MVSIEHLPQVYEEFRARFPGVADAQDGLAREVNGLVPFDERTVRLVKLALAIGAEAEGPVRSNVRKALSQGLTEDDLRAVALLAITTCGFSTCVAGLRWISDVLDAATSGA